LKLQGIFRWGASLAVVDDAMDGGGGTGVVDVAAATAADALDAKRLKIGREGN
jgi:hypothetical protein